ncbi:MAG: GNAT family N-acetyltransferase [Sphingobacteriales bacterium]|jgi:GNAT superfamily N-acetyltransferase|nr:GNAT family N-acetyltransferase [Sphingobacteriales bacterium]
MSLKIRIAFIPDIPKIIDVADATWKQTYAPIISQEQIEYMYERMYSEEALKEQMQNGITFLMCLENEKILGFIAYEIREDKILYIPKLYVLPDKQKTGIGKKLIEEVVKIGIRNNCTHLELNVNRKNPAMYFYKKMSFELFEKTDIAYGPFWLNDYILRKPLL